VEAENAMPPATINPWMIALTVMIPTFMKVLDTTIANVALKNIAGSLSASIHQATWVLTSYLIANAIVIPCAAWIGQRFGRKRFLLACVLVFTVASFLCGLATSLPMLIVMRVIQGAGGGAFQPIAFSIMLESFPKEQHGKAMGIYGLGVVFAPVIGPVLGGWITDNASWPWIFFIKVPVGIVALALIQRYIHDPAWIRDARPGRLDALGLAFMSLWLGCQEVLLDKGQEDDWFQSRFIIAMAALAVIGLIVFTIRELRTPRPIVDLRVVRNYNFSLGSALMFFAGLAIYSMTAVIPLFMQSLMGYTALQSGLAMLPRGLGSVMAMPLVGRLVNLVPGRYLVATGFLLFGISSFALTRISQDSSGWTMLWPLFLSGMSLGFMIVPLSTIAMGSLKPEQIGNASGIFNLMRNVGGSVGIALATTFAERGAQAHQATLTAHLTPYDDGYRSTVQTLTTVFAAQGDGVAAHQRALGTLYNGVLNQASLLSYIDIFVLFSLMCLACLIAALCLKTTASRGPVAAH
jgi:MFS transporter, DHA2 family, multidrug resistance protein